MVAGPISSSQGLDQVDEYRLIRPLGHTGRSTFLAHDRSLDRAVVLSFIAPGSGEVAGAALAGARALAGVTHPNLCRVHRVRDTGVRPYVVSELARGQRVDAVPTPWPDRRVLDLGRALAGALSTLHLAGVAHGDVRVERIAMSEEEQPLLYGFHEARPGADEAARLRDLEALTSLLTSLAGPTLQGALAALAERTVLTTTADELRADLEALANPAAARDLLVENPYRGLRTFEAEHAAVFFGRQRETADLLARLRGQPFLLVAGRSGAGKSSLARAGLGPAIAGGALGERAHWDVVTVVPGPSPLVALASQLAPVLGRDAVELAATLRRNPGLAGRVARARTDRGLLLLVDRLEEALTLADADGRDAFAAVLARFGALAPGVRVVMTLRSDFLARLGELGPLGRDLLSSTYVLPAMTRDGLREAVVGPARARGFAFESPGMVDALLGEVSGQAETLPLLSFALAELWNERDPVRRIVPEEALARLGGAAAALARHGELVLAALQPEERGEARRILVALATAASGETRARFTEAELLAGGGVAARAALAALVQGRLVVAGETYGIARETLVRGWPRLRAWLDEASDARAAAARLAVAAREWDRLGRPADVVWNARQLRDLEAPGALDGTDGVGLRFIDASRRAVLRARVRRLAIRIGVPFALALFVAAIAGALRWSESRATAAFVAARLAEADGSARDAAAKEAQVEAARADAFAHYDASDWPGGETRWHAALALAHDASDRFVEASTALGLALARDPRDAGARAHAADLAYAWLLVAERDHHPELARDLRARLAILDDDGSRRARLDAHAHLRVTTSPPGGSVAIARVRVTEAGLRVEDAARRVDLGSPIDLEPGSYVLHATEGGRYPTRQPLLLERGESAGVEVALPAASAIPPGFAYIPDGVGLFGAADVDSVRGALFAQPEHPVHVDAFLIGEHEVTFAEYLAFLDVLSPAERKARSPRGGGLALVFGADGTAVLTVNEIAARRGEPFCRPKRTTRRCQDWSRFPVAGIGWDDATAYARWLAASSVPGARLCTEREWERAARGADERPFPLGDAMHPGDANFDATYGTDEAQMGADEVGSFPLDVSPFGVFDLGSNVVEWVADSIDTRVADTRVARGGNWRVDAFGTRTAYRRVRQAERHDNIGFRMCAAAPR